MEHEREEGEPDADHRDCGGDDAVYNQIHRAAKDAGMSLRQFVLWKTIGLKLEARAKKEPKPKAPRKPKAKKASAPAPTPSA